MRKVYFAADNHRIYSLLADGGKDWTFLTGKAIAGTPLIAKNCIYAGTSEGEVIALTGAGGLKWKQSTGAPIDARPILGFTPDRYSSPPIYVASEDHKIYAFDSLGNKKWSYPTGGSTKTDFAVMPQPGYSEGSDGSRPNRIVLSANRQLYALDDHTGTAPSLAWQIPADIVSTGGVATEGDDNNIYVAGNQTVARYEVGEEATTKLFDLIHVDGAISGPPVCAYSDDQMAVFVATQSGCIYNLNHTDLMVRWIVRTGSPMSCSPAVDSYGNVYVGSTDGNLYAIHSDGSVAWVFHTGGPIYGSPAFGSGYVYVGSSDGSLYVFKGLDKES